MAHRGKFIAVEGIDGSGKHTQFDLLSRAFDARGVAHVGISFPRYQSFFGAMVARYLNGEFGQLREVDPHFSALLYANDRLEAKPELDQALDAGKWVLADRYVGSNLAHQTARVPPADQENFLAWLQKLEYEIYGLPREDLVIYLRVPPAEAQQLVARKPVRDYTQHARDLQEADLAHLQAAASVYDRLAKQPNWATVECLDRVRGRLREPEAIQREAWEAAARHGLP